jgi:hypothetical protein
MARMQRLAMSPAAAAASLEWIGKTDVRDVLPSVQCPTLVLRPEHETYLDVRHSRYVAEHVPNARYVEVPGVGTPLFSEADAFADEIQHFLTGARRPVVSDRVLATVLFTDIVGSTERAAELGDGAWRSLLERHDSLVRGEVQRHRWRFVKSLGDGALALFDGPSCYRLFFTVETAFLRRYYVLFFIELASRRGHLAGCSAHPSGRWITQQACNLSLSGALGDMRFPPTGPR